MAPDFCLRRISPTLGYQTQPYPAYHSQCSTGEKGSSSHRSEREEVFGRREIPLGYWLTFFIHLAFATVYTYIRTFRYFIHFFLCSSDHFSVCRFGFCLTHTFLRFVASVTCWRTPHPLFHLTYNLILMPFIIAIVVMGPDFVLDALRFVDCTSPWHIRYPVLPPIKPPILISISTY